MKILTTQNLNLNQTYHQSTNVVSKDFRLNNANVQKGETADSFARNVSFGKRIPFDKIVGQTKEKAVKAIKDNLKTSSSPVDGSVNKFLEQTTKQEVLITAVVSAVLAGIMRPLTLMLISNDKEKNDMAYASAHAISSAAWGFVVPFIFIRPFAGGYNKVLSQAHKYLSPNEFKARFPQADITNPANWIDGKVGDLDQIGVLKPIKEQVDRKGNQLLIDIKDVFKIALPKHYSELSNDVKADYFDASGKLKSLKNTYITMIDESKAEALSKERTFWDKLLNRQIKPKYYELNECTNDILKEAFPELDIATVGERGKRDFSAAKNIDGSNFVLDNKYVYISDWRLTDKAVPYSTGETFNFMKTSLFSNKQRVKKKDICYQKNGPDHSKGTPIEEDMVKAAGENEVHNKFGQWLPDIIIAYPRATATIALLPFILKKVFHLEKTKKPTVTENTEAKTVKAGA